MTTLQKKKKLKLKSKKIIFFWKENIESSKILNFFWKLKFQNQLLIGHRCAKVAKVHICSVQGEDLKPQKTKY